MEAPSNEMCQKVKDMILQDRSVKINVITHELGISAGTVSSITHSVLIMSRVSSRWVPQHKACHQQFSEENLDMLLEQIQKPSSQEFVQGMKHGSIIMIQGPNKNVRNGNTRGLLLPRNYCNNQLKILWQRFFGTQKLFCF